MAAEGTMGSFWGHDGQAKVILADYCEGKKHNSAETNGKCFAGVKITRNLNVSWKKANNKSETGIVISVDQRDQHKMT